MSRLATRQKKIESLMSKHQHFESILNQVNKSISVDDLVITDIKKKKLKIRDEILRLNK
ncbi:MAG: DUF465 domain-containing protein [Rickettsiales bacterium]|jgi:hypothetical protein|nr:DUF465 domain-containing protein [Rickettsiales bacterium]RPG14238.1 MAG: DUF465 domain-containing protein [Pelagibacteraceae bacterium TMED195]|tara:strand:+ start:797 stop:973 length:177 start_codon:yes stop_codon:yes gene_type:complete